MLRGSARIKTNYNHNLHMKPLVKLLFVALAFILISCSQERVLTPSLLGEISIVNNSSERTNLTEIFGENYRVIKLKSPDGDNRILSVVKVIKRAGNIYLSSRTNEILIFDEYGNFKSKISKKGAARDEYLSVMDFDVVIQAGVARVFVSDETKINIYQVGDGDCQFERSITFPNVNLDKFTIFNDKIIAKIRGDQTLLIANLDSDIAQLFYPLDSNNIATKINQFIVIGDECIYQNGTTNSCVKINSRFEDSIADIVTSDENILTERNAKILFDREQDKMATWDIIRKDYLNLFNFQRIGNTNYMIYMTNEFKDRYLVVKTNGQESRSYCFFGENTNIIDDILHIDMPSYIASMLNNISDCGIIINIESSYLQDKTVTIQNEFEEVKHTITDNENDYLLEFIY